MQKSLIVLPVVPDICKAGFAREMGKPRDDNNGKRRHFVLAENSTNSGDVETIPSTLSGAAIIRRHEIKPKNNQAAGRIMAATDCGQIRLYP